LCLAYTLRSRRLRRRCYAVEESRKELKDLQRFIATTSCVLMLALAVAAQSAHAQGVQVTPSDKGKSVTSNPQRVESTNDPQLPEPTLQSPWFSRVGVLVAPYHSSATIATNGQTLSGGTAEASNNMSVTFDLGYEVTKNISVSVMSGIPVKPHVT